MSRIYTGIGILLLLLAVCCSASFVIPKLHLDISRQLEQAAQCAKQENWPQATRLAAQAAQDWKRAYDLTAVTADHSSAEEIDALFAALEQYAALEEVSDFAATAMELSHLTTALGSGHRFSWWNFL
jgi:hypothetical protein